MTELSAGKRGETVVTTEFFKRMPGGGTVYQRDEAAKRIAEALDIPVEALGPGVYKCDGNHFSQTLKQVETLEVLICDDPTCARVYARCICPNNTWNEDGTVLTCGFCGRDNT